ncbi:MAG TPA: ABC transporter permease [Candidatus Limnocylindrales bacterium]|nr:ABC transporter permease [Candidatus Limnocylindrales bacterium]
MSLAKALTRILSFVGKELVEVVRRPGVLLSLILGPFLILAIFGAGYSGYRRPLDTVVVVPPDSGLPTDVADYSEISGAGLEVTEVTTDQAAAEQALENRTVDVVLVAPDNVKQQFQAGKQSTIQVKVNVVDPVDQNYTTFLARALEREVNRIIVERIAEEGQTYALSQGADEAAAIPPSVVAAPTKAEVVNIAPSQPGVVQFFGTAVLALILQHMAVTLIALSVVRERTTGLFELFRVSPIRTGELVVGKIVAFGMLSAAIAAITLALLILGFRVPMLGDGWALGAVVLLLIGASLGLGLLVAAFSDSERQAVQLSLLLLLASVFFSGFVLGTDEFSEPVRTLTALLPVTNGIQLIGDVMLRGSTGAVAPLVALAAEAVAYTALAWLIIRRALRST